MDKDLIKESEDALEKIHENLQTLAKVYGPPDKETMVKFNTKLQAITSFAWNIIKDHNNHQGISSETLIDLYGGNKPLNRK